MRAIVGFDGFIDRLAHVVKSRSAGEMQEYAGVSDFAQRLLASAGINCDLELNTISIAPGGNAPIMAQAMGRLGVPTALIAAVGEGELHAAYAPWRDKCEMHPLGAPADTVALEFDDGKVMLADLKPLDAITWRRVREAVGLDALRRMVQEAELIALTCYSLLPHAQELWDGFRTDVLEQLDGRRRTFFFDLADPSKHDDEWVRRCCATLERYRAHGSCVLGLNRNEMRCLAKAFSIDAGDVSAAIEQLHAKGFADVLLVHLRSGCYAADASGVRWHPGESVEKPVISTGAGDHFNAGFCAALLDGRDIDAAVEAGLHVSHDFVLNGVSPEQF